ncbi:type VI secretion system amidase effector protein Tae4 [Serratia ficaria]|uniref:type VI secretion system amidase effector protein Tae4 n=1 Tax=Serratia ficaria TaxID=61651 RepID=UPI0021B7CBEB|nr:type VI secretion system amidase effector protein Tae4 [Serratia ficaria]
MARRVFHHPAGRSFLMHGQIARYLVYKSFVQGQRKITANRWVTYFKRIYMPITFSSLWENHPEVNGDANPCLKPNGDKAFDDQCAIRVGTALARCGYDVTKLSGVNFCWLHPKSEGHILRAEELAHALARTPVPGLGRMVKVTPDKFDQVLKGQTGIIFFKDYWRRGNESFRNRSGDHIDLWNGSRLTSKLSYVRIQWGVSWDGTISSFFKSKEVWFWRVI